MCQNPSSIPYKAQRLLKWKQDPSEDLGMTLIHFDAASSHPEALTLRRSEVWSLWHCEARRGISRSASSAVRVAADAFCAERLVRGFSERSAQPLKDLQQQILVGDFLHEHVDELFEQLGDLVLVETLHVLFAKSLGIGALQQPGRRPPMGVRLLPQQVQGLQLGAQFGFAEPVVKVGVAERFATDRAGIAAHVVGSPRDAAAGGNQRTDLAAFDFVERVGPTKFCHVASVREGAKKRRSEFQQATLRDRVAQFQGKNCVDRSWERESRIMIPTSTICSWLRVLRDLGG